ncbi:MAG: helix-turn-helix domain-containing protein [Gemmatimonadota bacterium]
MYDNEPAGPIGPQIRRLRIEQGLTQAEVAERTGTSAPTMHRYETGWDRFQIATLRRIAEALGATLEVRLVQPRGNPPSVPTEDELLDLLAPLFWDSELGSADLERFPGWVLERVVDFGNREQMAAARAWFGDEALAEAIERPGVDVRSRNYWRLILEDACTRKC